MEDAQEEAIVPAGHLASPFDAAALALLLSEQVEGDMAQYGEVLGGIAGSDPALILMKREVQDPMNGVFDPPMAPDGITKDRR